MSDQSPASLSTENQLKLLLRCRKLLKRLLRRRKLLEKRRGNSMRLRQRNPWDENMMVLWRLTRKDNTCNNKSKDCGL